MSETDVLRAEMGGIRSDMGEMRQDLSRLADAVVTLARLEERQASMSKAQDRAFSAIAKLEGRVSALERSEPMQAQVTSWMMSAVWAAAGAAAMFAARAVGLL